MELIQIDKRKCKRDGICVAVCPMNILEQGAKKDYPSVNPDNQALCILCGHCVAVCPHDAVMYAGMNPDVLPLIDKHRIPGKDDLWLWMQTRRSIRTYKLKTPSRHLIGQLIQVASHAPTGHNDQPLHWLVINDREKIRALNELVVDWMRDAKENFPQMYTVLAFDRMIADWEKGEDPITRRAPCLLLTHADTRIFTGNSAGLITMAHLELAAHAAGLGTCWAGIFTRAAATHGPLMEALKLPDRHGIVYAMMLGYPRYSYQRIPLRRKSPVHWL